MSSISSRIAWSIAVLFFATLEVAWATDAAPPAVGTAAPGRFLDIFRPVRTEIAALSPDGKLLAYSIREQDRLYVLVVEVDNPSTVLSKILAGTDETSTPVARLGSAEKTPARIHWLGWATDNRLVLETNANAIAETNSDPAESIRVNVPGAIFAVNSDGSDMRTLATPKDVEERLPPSAKSAFEDDKILAPDQMALREQKKFEQNLNDSTRIAGAADPLLTDTIPRDVMPRSPTVLGFTKDKPDSITFRTSDLRRYQLYSANIHSGKLSYGSLERADDDMSVLLDRQGHPGAVIKSTALGDSFPRSYLVPKPGKLTLGRWRALDSITKTRLSFSISPENYFGERSFPIGFDDDKDILYYASNIGKDTYGVYGLNLKTGEKTGRTLESPVFDLADAAPTGFLPETPLVFDRYTQELVGLRYQGTTHRTIWLRPDLQEVKAQLQAAFPNRSITINGWDRSADRFLVRVYGTTDAGGFYILQRSSKKLSEFARSAPEVPDGNGSLSHIFSFPNPAGGTLSGILVIPQAVRQKPIPLVVLCADDPWLRFSAEFDPTFSALTTMGFAVVQINPRGTWGFGLKHRQNAGEPYDAAQVQDIVASIDALLKGIPILSAKNVAIMGHNRGGFLALRALQLRPDRFRCAIGINPTISLQTWLAESRWNSDVVLEKGIALKPPSQQQRMEADYQNWLNYHRATATTADRELRRIREVEELERKVSRGTMAGSLTREFFGSKVIEQNSLLANPASITRPIFLLPYRRDGEAVARQYADAMRLGRLLEANDVPVTIRGISDDYINGFPEARADVFRHIEDFLNLNIYVYKVNLGETQIKEDDAVVPPKSSP